MNITSYENNKSRSACVSIYSQEVVLLALSAPNFRLYFSSAQFFVVFF